MELKNFKCPNCGNNISVKSLITDYKCEFCGTSLILDKNEIKIVAGEYDQKIKNAEAYLKFEEYDKALLIYKELSTKLVDNKEIWLGVILSITKNLKLTEISYQENLNVLIDAWNKYKILCDNKIDEKYKVVETIISNTIKSIRDEQKNGFTNWIIFISIILGFILIMSFIANI